MRIKYHLAIGLILAFLVSAGAQNTFNVPVIFANGSSIDVDASVPLTGDWDFTGATLTGIPATATTLTGNVTGSGTGSIATTVVTIPDLVAAPGSILSTNVGAPTAPASGKTKWFTDSTDKRFHDRNDTGSTGTTVVASSAVPNQFLTAISTAGVISRAQPAFADLSSTISTGQGGVAAGGSTAQVFTKLSGTNYDTVWRYNGGIASVTSTVDQTATTETAHVVWTVPANSAAVGTTYRVSAWGDIDNGTTAITFTPRIRWGGTGGTQLIATPTIVGTTTAQTNKTWRADALVTIRTTGATGTAFVSLQVSNHTASTTGVYAQDEADSGGTGVTIDTTANKDLDLTWTLSATTGTPHLRTYGGFVEVTKP